MCVGGGICAEATEQVHVGDAMGEQYSSRHAEPAAADAGRGELERNRCVCGGDLCGINRWQGNLSAAGRGGGGDCGSVRQKGRLCVGGEWGVYSASEQAGSGSPSSILDLTQGWQGFTGRKFGGGTLPPPPSLCLFRAASAGGAQVPRHARGLVRAVRATGDVPVQDGAPRRQAVPKQL